MGSLLRPGPHITTPLRENIGVHHSKIDRRMAEMGHSLPIWLVPASIARQELFRKLT